MTKYRGSCHCGAVQFEVEADVTEIRRCNCSLCHKRGTTGIRVDGPQLRVLRGEDNLTLYQFNTKVARHYFCRTCGIYTFHRPRTAPDAWGVNALCLDGLDVTAFPLRAVDGRSFSTLTEER